MIPLVVIGAGPTGIAALVEARRLGITAIGLEAGAMPLAAVQSYLEGLIFLSPAWNYEVGELPLDCRDGGELTREEVLHYFARIVAHHRLAIRCGARCTALVPHGDRVEIHVDGGEPVVAGNVIVTAWYERCPPDGALAARPGVAVVGGLPNATAAAGRRVVVIGGGMSAFEHATMLMTSGAQITVVARARFAAFFALPGFQRLVEATGSSLIAEAGELATCDGGVAWRTGRAPADLVVACLGARISPAIAALLGGAGVVDGELLARLAAAPTPEQLARTSPALSAQAAYERALAERPDLWRQLFDGVGGIRLAGGALHTGGADAGVLASIKTAELAVRAVAGQPPPCDFTPPLPVAIARWCKVVDPQRLPPWDVVAALRPLAIRSFTRTTPRLFVEAPSGELAARADVASYLAPRAHSATALEMLAVCDGTNTIADLAEAVAAETADDRAMLVRALCGLWRANGLTWLPAADDSPGDPPR